MAFKEDTSAILYVTVGTTRFDELIKVISKEILLKSLKKNFGINRVIAQIGNSFVYDIQEAKEKFKEWMVIEIYRFKPDIREDLLKADYIISHAGAGTSLEALHLKKKLIVVVNEVLMGNHQMELATELAESKHAIFATCSTLEEQLSKTTLFKDLVPLKPADPYVFPNFLKKILL